MKARVITWQEIAEVFTIIDGELWRKATRLKLGRVPTTPRTNGYVQVTCKGYRYYYHRLIYMLHHQITLTPLQQVDHIIEGNKSDNRIENLQILSAADNVKKGVSYKLPKQFYGKYRVYVRMNDASIAIGSYSTEQDYWATHAKTMRLFGVGTKGLAFAQSLNRADAKEFVQLAMVA